MNHPERRHHKERLYSAISIKLWNMQLKSAGLVRYTSICSAAQLHRRQFVRDICVRLLEAIMRAFFYAQTGEERKRGLLDSFSTQRGA